MNPTAMVEPQAAPDIRRHVIDALLAAANLPAADARVISADTPLRAGGLGINSLALLQVFVTLESKLGFTFEDGPVANATLDTLGDFVDFVARAAQSGQTRADGA